MKSMSITFLLILISSSAMAFADVDGIKIGAAWDPPTFKKNYAAKGIDLSCDQMHCTSEVPTSRGNISILIQALDGRVLELSYLFPADLYDTILKGLNLGPPTRTSQGKKTDEYGVTVTDLITEWREDGQVATLEQYENSTTGMFSLKAPAKPY